MKSIFLVFTFLLTSILGFSQTAVKGTIIDETTSTAIPDVTLQIEETNFTTTTNAEGAFDFSQYNNLPLGEVILAIRKEGYTSKRYPITINENQTLDLGTITLQVDINEENLQIGTISLSANELDNEESSAANLSGLLQASRDTYLNAAAFDFSSTFFRPRGLDNEYGTVLINGVEMNKQFDGRPQWSSWGGLNDAQRNQVFSMGLSANDYTFGGVSGTNNIIMRASQYREGGRVSYASSNRSYRGRVMASYNSGLSAGGWAYSFLASRRYGEEGYLDGTLYDANSFFASIEKKINENHSLNFTGFFTPNRRGKSTAITQEVRDLKGRQYNPLWGYQDGEIRNSREKEIAEPILMLNHYWDISDKTSLNTNIAYQTGMIGNSRIDNNGTKIEYDSSSGEYYYPGGARNPTPEYYQNLPSYHLRFPDLNANNYQAAYLARQAFQNDGQLDWRSLYSANIDANGNPLLSTYVIQQDRQDDTQLTFNSIVRSQISNNITLNGSLNYRKLKSEFFAELEDLLGGSGYVDVDSFYQGFYILDENGNITSREYEYLEAQSDVNNPNRIAQEGDRYKYNYEINTDVATAFAQAQFKYNKIDFYLGANFSQTSYQRNGLYRNGYFSDGNLSFGESEQKDFTNYGAKIGGTYKVTGRHLIDANLGYMTKAPSIRNSFSNARQNNDFVVGLESEKITSADVSYIFRSPLVKARITGFYTGFEDGTDIGFYFGQGFSNLNSRTEDTNSFIQEVLTGIERRNAGGEFGVEYQVTPTVKLKAAGSYAQYVYTNNPNMYYTSDDVNTGSVANDVTGDGKYTAIDRISSPSGELGKTGKVYLEDYHVAGGPEKAFQIGFEYRDPDYWWVGVTANYFDDAYIDVSKIRRSDNFNLDSDGLPFNDYDPARARELLAQENFGDYTLFNLVGGKSWKIDDYFVGFFATINNVFDTEYKTGGFEQSRNTNYRDTNEDMSRQNGEIFGNRYFFGYGTTYYLNLYVRF
ncbi:carboxypeptidase-like regulatory domain-containing protein [Mesonia sp. K7]|uniref:carboxypeptidase-like regulatory domain-containing protein n=1 Tax=Mesonia sp. K7 TaxID=2218606 RepID=UPI000DAA292B|nr:carboxypeptidase-like regulatory domain-containing protein [Mesonia sp. K7]PZD78472.1 TonB-dependent receptor [Mesonia sp. K7]